MEDMQHNDEAQDAQMIISVLQKVIDDMKSMESDRLMPDHMKPKVEMAKIDVAAPKEDTSMPEDEQDSDLDPDILSKLMDKANSADDNGATPEDNVDELDPDIADIIRNKKAMK
jgi:hypothetical protein